MCPPETVRRPLYPRPLGPSTSRPHNPVGNITPATSTPTACGSPAATGAQPHSVLLRPLSRRRRVRQGDCCCGRRCRSRPSSRSRPRSRCSPLLVAVPSLSGAVSLNSGVPIPFGLSNRSNVTVPAALSPPARCQRGAAERRVARGLATLTVVLYGELRDAGRPGGVVLHRFVRGQGRGRVGAVGLRAGAPDLPLWGFGEPAADRCGSRPPGSVPTVGASGWDDYA